MQSLNTIQNYKLPTKSEASSMASALEDEIRNGEISALDARIEIAFIEEFIKKVKASKVIREEAIKESDQYGKLGGEIMGAKFQTCETGVDYDYSGSSAWVEANKAVIDALAVRKHIESIAKATKIKTLWVDPETGEELEIVPPIKKSTTNVKITLSK